MVYWKAHGAFLLPQWLSSLGPNLLNISTTGTKKLLMSCWKVRNGVHMPSPRGREIGINLRNTYLKAFSNQNMIYQVVTSLNVCSTGGGNHSYEVRLLERTCSCGKWQNIKTPCSHAIRVCDVLKIDSTTYIHPCYNLDYALNTYSHAFAVPKSESLWRDPMGPKWLPNLALLRAKDQPMKSRIRSTSVTM